MKQLRSRFTTSPKRPKKTYHVLTKEPGQKRWQDSADFDRKSWTKEVIDEFKEQGFKVKVVKK